MKNLLSIFLISISLLLIGQKKYSTSEIFNTFPLGKASKVKIISYNTDFRGEFSLIPPPPNKKLDSIQLKEYYDNLKKPIKLIETISKENFKEIKESKTLNLAETLELSKLLFNTCGKFSSDLRETSMCFFPRNAILFYDEDDKVFDFLEICFECHRMQFFSEKATEVNGMCSNFYSKLEKYFQNKGLQTQYN
ncbi:hypothetical protein [Chryseobacterium sediminis]|uniref:Uncharacterized protein n=1 Tax=Chryseobacterium sediminis TaxID=1679494 RepID=A0A5B2UBN1_9FLAO|nr:hypothetical protein [Chryseobacterium sediminis]KAA2223798.1 hypothetical protein FW780_06240 [Chryseobacterium sediminis]